MPSERRGLLVVLSGPSGTGKTTLARALLERHGEPVGSLVLSVSLTTRPARPGEVDGRDYFFVTEKCFAAMLLDGAMLEQTELYGHRYATPRSAVEKSLQEGKDVLLVLDAQGRQKLAEELSADLVSIFLLPPSLVDLAERLLNRGGEGAASVSKRRAAARNEIAGCTEYDYVLFNHNLTSTLGALDTILTTERRKRRGRRRSPGPLRRIPRQSTANTPLAFLPS